MMLQVTGDIAIDESQMEFQFVRSSGPGGQNVNKVATAVQLRVNIRNCGLPADVEERLIKLAGRRMSQDGVLLLSGRRFRTQERNREDVIDRLIQLVRQAAVPVRKRRRTRPTSSSVRKRLEEKRRRSEKKRDRDVVDD